MPANRTRNTATAQRRQRQIEDCLFENLLHTPWQSISVADICRQVGISRKAYYNYYKDKEDCLCAYIDRLLRDSMLHVTQTIPENATALDAAVVMLNFWKEQRNFLEALVKNNLTYFMMVRNIAYALEEDQSLLRQLSTSDVPTDVDIVSSYTAIQLSLVFSWLSRGFDTPTEEMAKKLLRLLFQPMIPQTAGIRRKTGLTE